MKIIDLEDLQDYSSCGCVFMLSKCKKINTENNTYSAKYVCPCCKVEEELYD